MKILHVTTHFYPFVGGLENLVLSIATEQAKTHEVTILTLKYDKSLPNEEVVDGVKIIRLPAIRLLKNQYSIPRLGFSRKVRELNSDVLFTHTRFFITSALAGFSNPGSKMKEKFEPGFVSNNTWIHVEHGQNFVEAKNIFLKLGARLLDLTIGKFIFRKADKIVVLGERGREFVNNLAGRKDNVFVISNGVKIPVTKNAPRKNKALFFGRIIPEKGVGEIIEAAKSIPNWTFDIYGKGGILGSKDNVVFHGEITPDQVSTKIQESDLVILPSWSEGNSLAVLEAAANARPILATPVGQNEKVISPEFLIPVGNVEKMVEKLDKFEGSFDTLEREGLKNREIIKKDFSFKEMVRKYEDLV